MECMTKKIYITVQQDSRLATLKFFFGLLLIYQCTIVTIRTKKNPKKTRTYNYTINYLVMRGERESRKCKYKRVSGGQENSLKRKDPRSIDIQ